MLVCKSYVVGQFDGYIGEEEYWLGDGSIWRIKTPIYQLRKKQNPRASVYRDENRHFLSVKGMAGDVEVEAVHLPRFLLETPVGNLPDSELLEQLEIRELTKRALKKWYTSKAAYERSLSDA